MNIRRNTIKLLIKNGYVLKRHGANHDIYFNKTNKKIIPVKRHDFDECDREYILREADIKT